MPTIYLACFSQARDKESQWIAYGDSGHGVCLGIGFIKNEPPPNRQQVGITLLPVDYLLESWECKLRAGFEDILAEFDSFIRKYNRFIEEGRELALSALFRLAAYAATTGKYAQWAPEEECRLLVLPRLNYKPEVLQRIVHNRPVEYINFPLRIEQRPIMLTEILIGPNQDPNLSEKRIRELLEKVGYPNEFADTPRICISSRR